MDQYSRHSAGSHDKQEACEGIPFDIVSAFDGCASVYSCDYSEDSRDGIDHKHEFKPEVSFRQQEFYEI